MTEVVLQDGDKMVTFSQAGMLGLNLKVRLEMQELVIYAVRESQESVDMLKKALQHFGSADLEILAAHYQQILKVTEVNGLGIEPGPGVVPGLPELHLIFGLVDMPQPKGQFTAQFDLEIVPDDHMLDVTEESDDDSPSFIPFVMEMTVELPELQALAKAMVAWATE